MTSMAVVTGGSGWLGRRLVRALGHGLADVPALASPTPRSVRCLALSDADGAVIQREHGGAEVRTGDVSTPASLDALFDGAAGATVFHCAGIIHPERVSDFYRVNTHGTKALIDAAVRAGAKRFVFVSSNSPIGCNPHPAHRFDETSPYNPYMSYGKSKRLAEEAVKATQATGRIETVIIRPPWFYGPGQPARQTTFFTMIKNGKMPSVGSGQNMRSMAYVDNIVQGLLLAESTPAAAGKTYWIADRNAYSMNQIVETVGDVLEQDFGMKVSRKRVRLPGVVSELALFVDWALQTVGLYHQKIHVLSELNKNIACSIALAERELGYAPTVELREGMRRSVQSLLDEGGTI
jgi:nucleoside-diphosphate-sugar epimerase